MDSKYYVGISRSVSAAKEYQGLLAVWVKFFSKCTLCANVLPCANTKIFSPGAIGSLVYNQNEMPKSIKNHFFIYSKLPIGSNILNTIRKSCLHAGVRRTRLVGRIGGKTIQGLTYLC